MKHLTILLLILTISIGCKNNVGDTSKETSSKDVSANQTLYFGGDIITMEGDKPEYTETVVQQDGKIVFVGSKAAAEKQYANATPYDLKGQTMMPGFIEPHLHPMIAAVILSGDIVAPYDWNLPDGVKKGVQGHDAYIDRLKKSIAENGKVGEVLFIWGYHPLWHGDLNKDILTQIAPDVPVAIIHRSFHEAYLNDKAVELFKISEDQFKGNPQVEWEKGHFYEAGWMALAPHISEHLLNPVKYKQGLESMTALMKKNGITTIAEQGLPNVELEMEYNLLKAEMDKNPPFEIYNVLNGTYLTLNAGGLEAAEELIVAAPEKYNTQNIFVLPKQVKLFADGAIYSLAMQMKEGYTDGFKGQWITPLDVFNEQMNFYWDKGYKINIHANGDLGIQMCLDIVEDMMKRNPRKDHRLTLHHIGYFTEDQADQMQRLGVETSANPYYLWALADKYSEVGLGPDRAQNLVHIKSLADRDIPFSFHSDFAMAPAEPLTLAWTAINRMTSEHTLVSQDQRVSVYDGMKAITIVAARTLNLENKMGSIKVGKDANFTLLKENPFKVDKMHIKDIFVVGSIYHGKMNLNK
ncbi:MAG: amidohydrolase [Flavobacteriaceae bacterium]